MTWKVTWCQVSSVNPRSIGGLLGVGRKDLEDKLEALLSDGWEPFAVTADILGAARMSTVWLRKQD